MALEVEATYENGVLKLDQPLPLRDQERVLISIKETPRRAARSYGLLRWTGDAEALRRIAEDPEFSGHDDP